MDDDPDLDALVKALQIKNALYCLIIGTIGLDDVVVDRGKVRVERNSDHEVGMVDPGSTLGLDRDIRGQRGPALARPGWRPKRRALILAPSPGWS